MTVLHEVIAAESDAKFEAKEILAETELTFRKRTENFRGFTKTLKMFDDERSQENKTESQPVATTVDEKLDYTWGVLQRAMDISATKENTNSSAKADVIVNGQAIIKDVPVVVLLNMEMYLDKIAAVYRSIPTLAPNVHWNDESESGRGLKVSNSEKTFRTERQTDVVVLYDATDKHPAQVEKVQNDVPVGSYETVQTSGLLTVGEKSRRLANIQKLQTAVKEARQRANCSTAELLEVGEAVRNFINS